MEVRRASSTDGEAIRTLARASLSESYSHVFDQETITEIVDEWYAGDRLDELLDEENEVVLLAVEDDQLRGFVQGALVQQEPLAGEIDWLHVSPQARGQRIGTQLLGQIQDIIEDQGAAVLRGKVIAQNQTGTAFYEDHGFEQRDSREITFSGETYQELIYENQLGERSDEEIVEPITGPANQELVVSYSEAERGAKGPFYTVFYTDELAEKYGYCCGNCDSVDTAMDAMGRIECNKCGNKRKATRWDAAYL